LGFGVRNKNLDGYAGGSKHLQVLLEETAKQSGIAYIAVTDAEGLVLAHSDKSRIGGELHDPATIDAFGVSDVQQWRLIDTPGSGKVFEVYKYFSPMPGFRREMWLVPWEACTDCGQAFRRVENLAK
jgi:two-component system sensor histidine kinase HydH